MVFFFLYFIGRSLGCWSGMSQAMFWVCIGEKKNTYISFMKRQSNSLTHHTPVQLKRKPFSGINTESKNVPSTTYKNIIVCISVCDVDYKKKKRCLGCMLRKIYDIFLSVDACLLLFFNKWISSIRDLIYRLIELNLKWTPSCMPLQFQWESLQTICMLEIWLHCFFTIKKTRYTKYIISIEKKFNMLQNEFFVQFFFVEVVLRSS